MRSSLGRLVRASPSSAWAASRSVLRGLTEHWALAGLSLIAAIGVWAAVQDVDNPRVAALAPANGGIDVQARNVPDGYLIDGLSTVKVNVEARKSVMAELTRDDFKASIDVKDAEKGSQSLTVPVKVEATRGGVRVLSVEPPTIPVTLVPSLSRDVPVTIRRSGSLPDGYEEDKEEAPAIDPAFVTIRGRKELVDSVSAVELDVNLGGARDATVTFEGALTARTESGNVVDVALSQARARATFKINQVFIQRSFALNSSIVGQPQAGYAITNITIDPPVVLASGPKAIVNSLTQTFLNVEKLDITNATKTQTATRKVELPPNVSVDRQTVVVKVEISPLTITQTLYIGPAIENPPAGLAIAESGLTVAVRATGPYNLLYPPNPANFKVTVSLAGAAAGPGVFAVKVTAPAGITVDPIDPITLTLRPAVAP